MVRKVGEGTGGSDGRQGPLHCHGSDRGWRVADKGTEEDLFSILYIRLSQGRASLFAGGGVFGVTGRG